MFNKKIVKRSIPFLMSGMMMTGILSTAYAAPSDNYILFLPKNTGVTFTVDEDHVSTDYTTDDYYILLYKPGERVTFSVETDKAFTLLILSSTFSPFFNRFSAPE